MLERLPYGDEPYQNLEKTDEGGQPATATHREDHAHHRHRYVDDAEAEDEECTYWRREQDFHSDKDVSQWQVARELTVPAVTLTPRPIMRHMKQFNPHTE